jgi:F-type H+-transporting ATPase subunit delta
MAEYEKKLNTARDEAAKIIAIGKHDVELLTADEKAKAKAEIENEKERAKREINLAKDAAVAELRERVVTLTGDIAAKVIRREINHEDHRAFIATALNDIGANKTSATLERLDSMAHNGTNKPLAAIYGQALFEAARDAGMQERVASELISVKDILTKDPRIGIFLETPVIAFENKRKVIDASFKDYTPVTRNFLLVIAERGRAPMIDQIVDAYAEYANVQANVATIEVQTARPLDADERERVQRVMGEKLKKMINLNERVNPELMGGMVIVHEDKMWDSSLRRKLDDAIKTMEIKTNLVKWTE